MKLLLASHNLGKLREIREVLSDPALEWLTLREFPACPEVEETGANYLENARLKAKAAVEHSGLWALADDSGLEVEALGWRPGVRSARYAGENAGDRANNELLLRELAALPPERRRAVFRCVLVLRDPAGQELVASGALWGSILTLPRGENGFGYDPLFMPEAGSRSLAELAPAEKNRLSHRGCALRDLRKQLYKILK